MSSSLEDTVGSNCGAGGPDRGAEGEARICSRIQDCGALGVLRANVVLLATEGKQDLQIAAALGIGPRTAVRSQIPSTVRRTSTMPRIHDDVLVSKEQPCKKPQSIENQGSTKLMTASPYPFTLNCSRISAQGGLKTFACEIMQVLVAESYPCQAVVPAGFSAPPGVETIVTPASLAGASNLSLLRPVKWLAYSRFQFPIPKSQRILCTTHHVLPGRARQIVTIHDLRPYFFPDTATQSFYFRHMLRRALRHCDGVLTVSETSRQLIAETYKYPLEQIAIVPNVIEVPRPHLSRAAAGSEAYLLVVGASWPHKNIESLLSCHSLWSDSYALTIIAGEGQYRTSLTQLTQALGIAHRVQFLANIPVDELNRLYLNCSALIAPSRMEGFGLPPLEAMARRRPAIVADIPVFRELYGIHALYVNPEDSSSWKKVFEKLPHISSAALDAAQTHALSYNRQRMAAALRHALQTFWGI